MHGQTHADIVLLSVERLVRLERFLRLLCLFNNGTFNSLPELFKRIFRLQPQTKRALLELSLLLGVLSGDDLRLLLFIFFI